MQYFIKLFNLLNRTIKTKKEISMAVITAPVTAEVTSTHVSSMLYYRHTYTTSITAIPGAVPLVDVFMISTSGVLLATLLLETLLLEILPLTVVVMTAIKELLETLEELMLLVVKGDVDDPLVVVILLMLVTVWAEVV